MSSEGARRGRRRLPRGRGAMGLAGSVGLPVVLAALLLSPATAAADPAALRSPAQQSVTVDVGVPYSSAAWWVDDVAVAVWARHVGGGAFGLALGGRHRLAADADGSFASAYLSGGLGVAGPEPSLVVSLTPAIRVGRRDSIGLASVGVAAPFALRPEAAATWRLPLLLEGHLAMHIAGWTVGARGALGAAVHAGTAPTIAAQAAVFVGIPAPRLPR